MKPAVAQRGTLVQEYQQDADGGVSCKHRLPDDLHPISWCSISKELCCYNANCRVPILTPLSELSSTVKELVETGENLVDSLVVFGYDSEDCEALDAARTALAAARTVLKNLEGE